LFPKNWPWETRGERQQNRLKKQSAVPERDQKRNGTLNLSGSEKIFGGLVGADVTVR